MKQTSLEALNNHLFETIEMLKNNNDPKASPNEKIDVDIAKTIADLAKVIVDGYKVKVQALNIMAKHSSFDPNEIKKIAIEAGINSQE